MKPIIVFVLISTCVILFVSLTAAQEAEEDENTSKYDMEKGKVVMSGMKDKMGRKKRETVGQGDDDKESKDKNKFKTMTDRKKREATADTSDDNDSESKESEIENDKKEKEINFMKKAKGKLNGKIKSNKDSETTASSSSDRKKRLVQYSVKDLVEQKYTIV